MTSVEEKEKRLREVRRRLGFCHPPVDRDGPKPLNDVGRALRRQRDGK